jgi:predicted RNA binding protein YcfA (HicA-like mRNA interferase family)
MGQYDIPLKYRVVIKGLKKLGGIEIKNASNHQTATHIASGNKTTIPRHTDINKLVVGSIIDFLLDNDYTEAAIFKAFKIKK